MTITTSDEAVPTSEQPSKPCHDCPWRRKAAAGWLGGNTPEEWIEIARGEAQVRCHALEGPQCAGVAIFRDNICKLPRDPETLRLPADRKSVFASPEEFLMHHKRGTMKQYTFKLGNVKCRPGHRADCEHIEVVLEVTAENEEDALAELRVGNGTLISYKIGGSKGLPDPEVG